MSCLRICALFLVTTDVLRWSKKGFYFGLTNPHKEQTGKTLYICNTLTMELKFVLNIRHVTYVECCKKLRKYKAVNCNLHNEINILIFNQ